MPKGEKVLMETIERHVTCPVCLDIFEKPKRLTCGHTMCMKCLSSLMKENSKWNEGKVFGRSIHCPVCRSEHEVPPGGVQVLENDLTLIALVDAIRQNVKPSGDKRSSVQINTCKNHPGKELTMDCLTCNLAICQECLLPYHNGHRFAPIKAKPTLPLPPVKPTSGQYESPIPGPQTTPPPLPSTPMPSFSILPQGQQQRDSEVSEENSIYEDLDEYRKDDPPIPGPPPTPVGIGKPRPMPRTTSSGSITSNALNEAMLSLNSNSSTMPGPPPLPGPNSNARGSSGAPISSDALTSGMLSLRRRTRPPSQPPAREMGTPERDMIVNGLASLRRTDNREMLMQIQWGKYMEKPKGPPVLEKKWKRRESTPCLTTTTTRKDIWSTFRMSSIKPSKSSSDLLDDVSCNVSPSEPPKKEIPYTEPPKKEISYYEPPKKETSHNEPVKATVTTIEESDLRIKELQQIMTCGRVKDLAFAVSELIQQPNVTPTSPTSYKPQSTVETVPQQTPVDTSFDDFNQAFQACYMNEEEVRTLRTMKQ